MYIRTEAKQQYRGRFRHHSKIVLGAGRNPHKAADNRQASRSPLSG
jgi:hypothetical protein